MFSWKQERIKDSVDKIKVLPNLMNASALSRISDTYDSPAELKVLSLRSYVVTYFESELWELKQIKTRLIHASLVLLNYFLETSVNRFLKTFTNRCLIMNNVKGQSNLREILDIQEKY